jgi:hypothetical protein
MSWDVQSIVRRRHAGEPPHMPRRGACTWLGPGGITGYRLPPGRRRPEGCPRTTRYRASQSSSVCPAAAKSSGSRAVVLPAFRVKDDAGPNSCGARGTRLRGSRSTEIPCAIENYSQIAVCCAQSKTPLAPGGAWSCGVRLDLTNSSSRPPHARFPGVARRDHPRLEPGQLPGDLWAGRSSP